MDVIVDVVLNHRSGGDLEPNIYSQWYDGSWGSLASDGNGNTWTAFPLPGGSGRISWPIGGGNEYFYPNAINNPDNTFDFYSSNQLNGYHQMYVNWWGYDNALHDGNGNVLPVGDSLIVWVEWLSSVIGFDGYRFDFVKGIHPEYLKLLLDTGVNSGNFSVGERLVKFNVWHHKRNIRFRF
jgi:alpha-amylase